MYLLILAVNSVLLIRRGLAEAPGQLPIWGPLGVLTTVLAMLLLGNARGLLPIIEGNDDAA